MLSDLHLLANISEHLYYEEGKRNNDNQIMSKVPSEKVVVQSFIKQIVVAESIQILAGHCDGLSEGAGPGDRERAGGATGTGGARQGCGDAPLCGVGRGGL